MSGPAAAPSAASVAAPFAATGLRWQVVWIILLTGVAFAAYGLLNPLLVVGLSAAGESNLTIGLVIGVWALPISLLAPVYPRLLRRLSVDRALAIALVGAAAPIVLLPLMPSPVAMMALQAVGGACFGMFWVASEAVMIRVVNPAKLGRIMSIWGLAPSIGALCGSLVPNLVGFEGVLPFAVSTGFMACAGLMALALRLPPVFAESEARRGELLRVAMLFPGLLFIAFISGVFESVPWAMLVAWGIAKGLASEDAVLLLSVFFAGQCLFAWHTGKIIDAVSPARAVAWFSALGFVLSLALTQVTGSLLATMLVVLLWSPIINAYRATAMVMLGRSVPAGLFLTANAVFVLSANSGELVGPPAAGVLIDRFGPDAMPMMVAAAAAIAGGAALVMLRRPTSRNSKGETA
ncbi:MFS transporter [Salinarimonas sp. NSM]|uniref:MFS transporter n=1 Tax=Salinarimonas sp. NSM TaxID=3458003 RepID=UPI0040374782